MTDAAFHWYALGMLSMIAGNTSRIKVNTMLFAIGAAYCAVKGAMA